MDRCTGVSVSTNPAEERYSGVRREQNAASESAEEGVAIIYARMSRP
jgi:hypothetical protein